MNTYYFYDARKQFISLTFSPDKFHSDAKHVLVWAYGEGERPEIVLTLHKRRGWEMPGGKVDPGEAPQAAAIRELFEETGAQASEVRQVAQYVIRPTDGTEPIVKNIYIAVITEWGVIPTGFETLERGSFPLDVVPFRNGFSPFMHDNIFPLCRKEIQR